jgi:hypothetical protein
MPKNAIYVAIGGKADMPLCIAYEFARLNIDCATSLLPALHPLLKVFQRQIISHCLISHLSHFSLLLLWELVSLPFVRVCAFVAGLEKIKRAREARLFFP